MIVTDLVQDCIFFLPVWIFRASHVHGPAEKQFQSWNWIDLFFFLNFCDPIILMKILHGMCFGLETVVFPRKMTSSEET